MCCYWKKINLDDLLIGMLTYKRHIILMRKHFKREQLIKNKAISNDYETKSTAQDFELSFFQVQYLVHQLFLE